MTVSEDDQGGRLFTLIWKNKRKNIDLKDKSTVHIMKSYIWDIC